MSTQITVLRSGPLRIEGAFELVDAEGHPFDLGGRARIHLCRCGQSATRPFCDNSHERCGFKDDAVARDRPDPASRIPYHPVRTDQPPAISAQPGSGKITVNANGAYRAEGDFELVDEGGRRYGLGTRRSISLCRCGASKDKPFCDGTHNTVRFRDSGGKQE